VGLFERTKHLEHLAQKIADTNLSRLGAPVAVDDAATRRQVLELESILREYRLNLQEVEARRELAEARVAAARARARTWHDHVRVAREKGRPDLAEQAFARAQVYDGEVDRATSDLEQHVASAHRIEAEAISVERRVAALRALRRGGMRDSKPGELEGKTPDLPPPLARSSSGTTRRLAPRSARDPLEEEIDRLRAAPPE
jgi:hypothetical protein